MLKINDLTIYINKNENLATSNKKKSLLIKNANINLEPGKFSLLTGSNGAGKSSLVKGVLGHPDLETEGKIILDDIDISNFDTTSKAQAGLFLSFQQPPEVEGVRFIDFARESYNRTHEPKDAIDIYSFAEIFSNLVDRVGLNKDDRVKEFDADTQNSRTRSSVKSDKRKEVSISEIDNKNKFDYETRELNVGFSGGERKKSELLQLLLLKPKYALLDEIDTGLDQDSLKIMYEIIIDLAKVNKTGFLIITHRQDIRDYLPIDKEYNLKNGIITCR